MSETCLMPLLLLVVVGPHQQELLQVEREQQLPYPVRGLAREHGHPQLQLELEVVVEVAALPGWGLLRAIGTHSPDTPIGHGCSS